MSPEHDLPDTDISSLPRVFNSSHLKDPGFIDYPIPASDLHLLISFEGSNPINLGHILTTLHGSSLYTFSAAMDIPGDRPLGGRDNPYISSHHAATSPRCLLIVRSWPPEEPARLTYSGLAETILGLEFFIVGRRELVVDSFAFDLEHEAMGLIGKGTLRGITH